MRGLDNEPGGHRIQRIPPTEKRGRVHTSTITVAVIDPLNIQRKPRSESEFKIEWYSGTGKGGQHRNKHQNCCRLIHLPTGLIQTAAGRERTSNLRQAQEDINRRLDEAEATVAYSGQAAFRKDQVGSGQRGDKRRTYRFQEDQVWDDRTGKTARLSAVMKGQFDLLWPAK